MSRKCMNLSSYTLKTAFLFHVYGENGCLYSRTLSACICEILDYMSLNLYYSKMPCFFARDMNTWGNILETPWFPWHVAEWSMNPPYAFALCWIKLMYQYLKYLKNIFVKKAPLFGKDSKIVFSRCDYFKKAVEVLMRHFSKQIFFWFEKDPESLESCTDAHFSIFIQKLKRSYNVDLSFIDY